MITNPAQKALILFEENKKLLEKIKELEKELYECRVKLMHTENSLYSK